MIANDGVRCIAGERVPQIRQSERCLSCDDVSPTDGIHDGVGTHDNTMAERLWHLKNRHELGLWGCFELLKSLSNLVRNVPRWRIEQFEPSQVFVVEARVGTARERLKGGRSEYSLGTVYSLRHACLVQ